MFVGNIFSGESGVDTGDIGHSLRFRGAQWLSRTPSVTGNRQKWVAFIPFKRGKLGAAQYLISASGSSRVTRIGFDASDRLVIYSATSAGGGDGGDYTSTRVFRDTTSWQFLVVAYDSTQATAGDRIKAWVNQDQITSWVTSTAPTLNHDTQFNWTGAAMEIGRYNATSYFEGYGARISVVDGGSGDNTTFGYLNTEINEWVSKSQAAVKAVVDAGGTNSFMLEFDDATSLTTLGYDKSSKGNNWTLNNFSLTAGTTYDHMLDVPGNSFATLNPLDAGGTLTLSNANLYGNNAGASHLTRKATFALPATGKHYWELESGSTSGASSILGYGVALMSAATNAQAGNTGVFCMQNDASHDIWNGASSVLSTGGTVAAGVIRQVAYDADTGKIWFGEGDVWASSTDLTSGNPTAGTNPCITLSAGDYFPWMACYANSFHINFGQAPLHASATYHSAAGGYFRYAPPTGFKALCQRNMSDPAILNPELHFDVRTRTGDAASPKVLMADLLFAPDFIWTKDRSTGYQHTLQDTVRGTGANRKLYSSLTEAEGGANSVYGYISSFNTNGVTATIGASGFQHLNANGVTYVDWLWKAGGTPVTNNAGSISSQVSANVEAGFSIVTYTSPNNAADQTVGHGLTKVPGLIIAKNRISGVSNWDIYHSALASGYGLSFTTTASTAGRWPTTAPTSSVFSTKNTYEHNGTDTYVAYCFAEIPGYSKIFSYTGNGSADGPYVHCGFKPKYVLIKCSSGAGDWCVIDTARDANNVVDSFLYPNLASAEQTSAQLDATANGFKFRGTAANINASGGTYIGIAFADVPAKYALAR